MNIKQMAKKNFQYLFYFYGYLRYRIFVAFSLSFLKGVLDGFGLIMFIPLLKITDSNQSSSTGDELGNLSFLPKFLEGLGLTLNIQTVLIIILLFFVLKGIVVFIEGYTRVVFQQLFMREIRITNIDLLNSYNYSSFVKADSGKIQNTFSGEVERVNLGYTRYFKTIEYGVLVLVYLVLAFSANAKFAIVVLVLGGISNFLFKWLFKKTKKLSLKFTLATHAFQGLLIQQVSSYKYLKASGLNRFYGEKLKANISEIEDVQKDLGIVSSLLTALREPISILAVVVAIMVQVTYFDSNISLIVLSLLFLYRALTYLMALQEQWNLFLSVTGSLDNVQSFSLELKENREQNGNIEFEGFNEKISLKNITFSYDDNLVIENLNLDIKKNETVALIGESGSGKTTLMNILAGLFIPSQGDVLIDGRDIFSLNLYSLRKKIGYISQEAPIFNDTVFNNVTFWAEKTSENLEKFKEAIKKASVYDFVYSLPKKEDEFLGNNGINISGGQKQRLAIARELFKDVELLFMDEATSALDGETEAAIKSNIDKLRGQYTIIIIAHRLATIKNADKIVLLKNGNIGVIGSFQELLKSSSDFRQMTELQGMSVKTP
ncbi:ABC transporter ATP-binding protein [Gillisia sp. JM1]|uniref:ABC transporter ATP-binding protein n=1 Tax=Gillisia sp. JM1 TaxID=1283286 RepID=UPI000414746D|nr:ABC transporter ATP-binding protein [Gillisia sp. JM1]